MSYTRGTVYAWTGTDGVHIWVRDTSDHHADAGWPEGVLIDQGLFDELVVMRYAELVNEGRAGEVAQRAVARWGGNGGCLALKGQEESVG